MLCEKWLGCCCSECTTEWRFHGTRHSSLHSPELESLAQTRSHWSCDLKRQSRTRRDQRCLGSSNNIMTMTEILVVLGQNGHFETVGCWRGQEVGCKSYAAPQIRGECNFLSVERDINKSKKATKECAPTMAMNY